MTLAVDGWPRADLAALVRASQRDAKLGAAWKAHVASAGLAHADPARVPVDALRAFGAALAAASGRGRRLVAALAPRLAGVEAVDAAAAPAAPRPRAVGAVDAAAIEALVSLTAAHPRFPDLYERRPSPADWTTVEGVGLAGAAAGPAAAADALAGAAPPPLLALDCEMVETAADAADLVRVALVAVRWREEEEGAGEREEGEVSGDGGAPPAAAAAAPAPADPAAATVAAAGAAAIDSVLVAGVRPKTAVTNWRAAITGLGPGALAAAPFSRRGAARAVAAALAAAAAAAAAARLPPPALVGHALHHDLAALKLHWPRVIDTALVFGWAGLPRAAPALADVHAAVLAGAPPLRAEGAAHCCERDAAAAVTLVLAAAADGGGAARRLLPPPAVKLDRDALCRLLAHSLPPGMGATDAAAALAAAAPAAPPSAGVADAGGPAKAWIVFETPAAADAAFAALTAAAGGAAAVSTDSLGRQQVSVPLAGGARVRVRRAGAHGGVSHGVDRGVKRDRTAAEVARGKRARAAAGGGGD